jgi:hypothetical protein
VIGAEDTSSATSTEITLVVLIGRVFFLASDSRGTAQCGGVNGTLASLSIHGEIPNRYK